MINGHGDDLFRYGGREMLNFSSNIVSGRNHGPLRRHLMEEPLLFSAYPEPDAASLARELGPEGTVAVTAGVTEAIYMIAGAWQGLRSAIVGPTFSEYEDACRMHGHTVEHISSPFDIPDRADIIWLCNPNNPTGETYDATGLLATIDAHPDRLFIVDCAYEDYSVSPVLGEEEALKRPNLITLHSFTKRFSIPGLRIGYASAQPALIARIETRRMPWSVNPLAIEAVRYLMPKADMMRVDARGLNDQAVRLGWRLMDLGIEVRPTTCNFLLACLPEPLSASQLKADLAGRGILIRDASNFHGLNKGHFRVAVQGDNSNDILVMEIREWLRKQ